MKQKVWVYEWPEDGDIRFYSVEKNIFNRWKLLGTTEIDIEPVKKEVVKEVVPFVNTMSSDDVKIHAMLTKDAYDIKVVYKVKE